MKLRVLITDDQEEIRDIVIMVVESIFDCDFIEASNAKEAIECLKSNDYKIDFIICDYNMPGGNGGVLYQHLTELESQIPYLHLSSEKPEDYPEYKGFNEKDNNNSLLKPFTVDDLENTVKNCFCFDSDHKDLKDFLVPQSEYSRINIQRFKRYIDKEVDVFIKLSDNKYIKIINSDDQNGFEVLSKYIKRDVSHVYVTNSDYEKLVNSTLAELSKGLSDTKLSSDEKIVLQSRSLEEIQACVERLGVSEEVVELADNISTSVVEVVGKEKGIAAHLKKLVNNKSYVFGLSHLMNYFCVSVAKEMDLSDSNIDKLVKASIFCNIAIRDDLAHYQYIDNESYYALELDERNHIKGHINKAVKIIEMSKSFVGEEKSIIECHHEKPDGSGFPRKLVASQLSVLSGIFNICHDFCHAVLLHNDINEADPQKILSEFNDSYQEGSYAKPYKALASILKVN